MQVKVFSVPIIGSDPFTEELNVFLRSKKIISFDSHLATTPTGVFWSFCIKYVEDVVSIERERLKVDYKQVLDEPSFKRFSRMREVRKQLAQTHSVPAYAIFTDEEMAQIAKLETSIDLKTLKSIKGIGDKKLEKYGDDFLKLLLVDETSE